MHRQVLLERVEPGMIQDLLDRGARIVYLHRVGDQCYDAVVETVKELEFTPLAAILSFLSRVDPVKLEQSILEDSLDVSMGEACLATLASMASEAGDGAA